MAKINENIYFVVYLASIGQNVFDKYEKRTSII